MEEEGGEEEGGEEGSGGGEGHVCPQAAVEEDGRGVGEGEGVPGAGVPLGGGLLGVGGGARGGGGEGAHVLRPHHHHGRLEGVVTKPELPDYPPVVAIVLTNSEVFTIQVRLKTAVQGS